MSHRLRPVPSPQFLAAAIISVFAFSFTARATPSFARQTGFSCSQCHTQFPELTAFGRAFKAGGYTMTLTRTLTEKKDNRTLLDLVGAGALSMMVQTSFTHTAKPQTAGAGAPGAQNDNVELPQQLSLFYAGRITPDVGAFTQLTYDGTSDHISLDNTDVRYARTLSLGGKGLVVGLTLNNNPTVQDLWNSTPAWGYPWASSDVAPSPIAAPVIAGALAQNVAGLGAYAFWDGLLYAELSAYHSAPLGVSRPLGSDAANVVSGVAPYWRLVAEKDVDRHALSVGSFGMVARLFPGAAAGLALAGPVDQYIDAGFDAQYQYVGDEHIVTGTATYIHEWQSLDATFAAGGADRSSHDLSTIQLSAGYLWERTLGLRMSYFATGGSHDTALYAPAGLTGSRANSPLTHGLTGEISYTPWLNTKLVLQETAYFDFNGSGTNYDGAGRDASANNTTYLLAWLSF